MADQAPPPEAKLLSECPTDGITSLKYIPHSSCLLASTSWDGCVRVHNTSTTNTAASSGSGGGAGSATSTTCGSLQFSHSYGCPLLSLAVSTSSQPAEDTFIYTGGLDGSIRRLQLSGTQSSSSSTSLSSTGPPLLVGKHEQAVSCLGCLDDAGNSSNHVVASASWDQQWKLWDVRLSSSSSSPVCQLELPGKAFSMDVHENRCVVATSGRRVVVIDVRMPTITTSTAPQEQEEAITAKVVLDRESSLKYQTRTVRFFPDGTGIALASVEGRVAIEYLEEIGVPPPTVAGEAAKKYAFKCHRQGDQVYPVNCIAFHPTFGTFATGGGDGTVVVWDGWNRRKLTSVSPAFATSIAALAFDPQGKELAIASSYTFEEGEREHPRDEIYIRPMLQSECLPKSK